MWITPTNMPLFQDAMFESTKIKVTMHASNWGFCAVLQIWQGTLESDISITWLTIITPQHWTFLIAKENAICWPSSNPIQHTKKPRVQDAVCVVMKCLRGPTIEVDTGIQFKSLVQYGWCKTLQNVSPCLKKNISQQK